MTDLDLLLSVGKGQTYLKMLSTAVSLWGSVCKGVDVKIAFEHLGMQAHRKRCNDDIALKDVLVLSQLLVRLLSKNQALQNPKNTELV